MDARYMKKTQTVTVLQKMYRLMAVMRRGNVSSEDSEALSDVLDRLLELAGDEYIEEKMSNDDKKTLNELWRKYK